MTSSPPSDPGRPAPTWEVAWQQALYGPAGFYRRSAPAEHFATSVQGIPGAGPVLAEAVAALAARHGCTRVVDVGCGRGELLRHLRAVAPALHLTGVDVVPRPEGVPVDDWLVAPGGSALPPDLRGLTDTLVLAHEWLDVVPCPVVQRDPTGVWRTLTVGPDGTSSPGPPLTGDDLAWAERWLDEQVERAEISLPRERALADLLGRVDRGVVVVVDYGHTRWSRPAGGTLTGFRDGREVDPVPDGSCDLTAHLAVDALVASLPEAPPIPRADVRLIHPQDQPHHLIHQQDQPHQLIHPQDQPHHLIHPQDQPHHLIHPQDQPHHLIHPQDQPHHLIHPQDQPHHLILGVDQSHVLRQHHALLSLLDVPDPSTPVPHDLARSDPTAYLRALRRRSALAALTARGGLGDFWWIVVPVGRDA